MVQAQRKGKLGAEITAGTHKVMSDTTTSNGGEETGMDPHRLLEASLSACTIITLQMYANLKKIDLKDIKVEVAIEKEGTETLINRKIKFEGVTTPEQRKRLIEIADKCPIHRLLTSSIKITTTEA